GQRLAELALGPQLLVEEQAMAPQTPHVAEDRLRRAVVLAGELAEAGAVGHGVERLGEQLRALEPVVGTEGLGGEVAPAVATAETLDALRGGAAGEEAGTQPAPRSRWLAVEWA